MKKGDIVIAPKGCREYLTAGKEYEVINVNDDYNEEYGVLFEIVSDIGDLAYCFEKNCGQLNGQDWILKQNKSYSRYQILTITDNMKRFGGGFIKALSEAIVKADEQNLEKLSKSFSEEFDKYLNFE